MRDCGGSFPILNRVLAQAERLHAMMGAVGADRLVAARLDMGSSWHAARTRCVACGASRQCATWLAASRQGAVREPPVFCPNIGFFLCCRKDVSATKV